MDATAGDKDDPPDIVKVLRAHMAREAARLEQNSDPRLLFLRWLYEHDSTDRDAVEPIDHRTKAWMERILGALDD